MDVRNTVIARSEATKQSSLAVALDCFASLAKTGRVRTEPSRIHVHEIAQQRIDFIVPAPAREHAVVADAGLHVVHLAVGAHTGAEVLRRERS
jgi:hypothetical protein